MHTPIGCLPVIVACRYSIKVDIQTIPATTFFVFYSSGGEGGGGALTISDCIETFRYEIEQLSSIVFPTSCVC